MPFRGLLAQCPAVPDVNQRGDAVREDRVFRPCHFSAASYRYESHEATVPPQGDAHHIYKTESRCTLDRRRNRRLENTEKRNPKTRYKASLRWGLTNRFHTGTRGESCASKTEHRRRKRIRGRQHVDCQNDIFLMWTMNCIPTCTFYTILMPSFSKKKEEE